MTNPLNIDLEKELGFENLSLEQQKNLTERMGQLLFQAVLTRVIEVLTDEEKDQLDQVLSKDGETEYPEELIEFLNSKVSNLSEIIAEEVAQLKKEGSEFLSSIN